MASAEGWEYSRITRIEQWIQQSHQTNDTSRSQTTTIAQFHLQSSVSWLFFMVKYDIFRLNPNSWFLFLIWRLLCLTDTKSKAQLSMELSMERQKNELLMKELKETKRILKSYEISKTPSKYLLIFNNLNNFWSLEFGFKMSD